MAPGSDHTPQDQLSEIHRQYLNDHAITDAVIDQQGIRSEGDIIVFRWRDGEHETDQTRQWPEPEGGLGDFKYLWARGEKGHPLHFNIARDPGPDAPVLLCEGTKQHLAVASWAPPEYAVYGMQGCRGWEGENCDLSVFHGRPVCVLLDADAASNADVYEAGERLTRELSFEDATALFIWSPAAGKDGIDDYLTEKVAPDRRTDRLTRLIAEAHGKPAERKPARRPAQQQPEGTGGPPVVIVNQSRYKVVREIIGHMQQRWNGRELFNYGGVLTRLRGTVTEPLDRDSFVRWMIEAVDPHRLGATGYEAALPEAPIIGALLASGDEFTELAGVSRTPFIRPDGSVCFKNGYDCNPQTGEGTKVLLAAGNSGMDRLGIPDAPSQDEARRAAEWLLGTWLSNMPWRDQASRANALALILTPFIRNIVPRVPLAVISGLQPSVGKNLLADCLSLMVTGEDAAPLSWIPDDDDEIRKALLSVFRSGATMAVFDEAHVIGGAALTKALTAATYTDRVLGVSKMASYPNRMTWVALGNQVQVLADMARRAYFIELYPAGPNPENRPESAFDIPELREWTLANRPELVTASLTVIRSWYAHGCPAAPRGESMGSFEAWDRLMSGILAWAGVNGFLAGMKEQRAERDATGGRWEAHLAWLREQFGPSAEFTSADVRDRAFANQGTWESPPRLEDVGRSNFTTLLGNAYMGVADRWMGGCRLVKLGKAHRKVSKWCVEDMPPDLGGRDPEGPENGTNGPPAIGGLQEQDGGWEGPEGSEGHSLPNIRAPAPAHDARTRAITRETGVRGSLQVPPSLPDSAKGVFAGFDLETLSADQLFTTDRGSFVRLAGVTSPLGRREIVTVEDLLYMLEQDPGVQVTYGHNILGFDGLALAQHHGLDWNQFAAKARDTELIARWCDPPRSRESGSSADKYGLDQVAERLGLPGKTDNLGRLKQKYGGYDIPADDPEYRAYLMGDLQATSAVADKLLPYYDGYEYVRREHQLAGIAGTMTLNGFCVDEQLLEQRVAEVNDQKRTALGLLHDGWGLPLSKTVMKGRGKDRHEEEQELAAPLAADVGRTWLERMYARYDWASPPRTAKTGKLALGSDDLKAVIADPACHPQLRAMLALMGKVTGSRTVYQTARDYLAPDGRVHPFVSMRQASGRWSVTKPGLTVFGKRGGRHVERDIFLPDEGHVLVSFDLSQVDMRAMAALSQDLAYLALFQPGKDAHAEIAAQVGLDRQSAKAIGHGWNYGLGPDRMIADGLDPDKVHAFIRGMEERFGTLIHWREQIRAQGRAGQILDNGFGRRMQCEPARAYTVAPALMGQGGARDIMCQCLLNLPRYTWPMLRVMVHDEIVMSVPAGDAQSVAADVLQAMTWAWQPPGARYSVPVLADMSCGLNWGLASAK